MKFFKDYFGERDKNGNLSLATYVFWSIAIVLAGFIAFKVFPSATDKVHDIIQTWVINWAKALGCLTVIFWVVFQLNKKWEDWESEMKHAGLLIFPILSPLLFSLAFGWSLWLAVAGALFGLIIAMTCNTIDNLLLDAWEVRHITIPIVLGISFSISVAISVKLDNWQDEIIIPVEYVSVKEVVIERYTYHRRKRSSYYSWDYHRSYYKYAIGSNYPSVTEGVDYHLGHGAMLQKDRVRDYIGHRFIGGTPLDRKGVAKTPKWVYLTDPNMEFALHKPIEVEENFIGSVLFKKEAPSRYQDNVYVGELPHKLPVDTDMPNTWNDTSKFFDNLVHHPDFAILRWLHLLLFLPFVGLTLVDRSYWFTLVLLLISYSVILLIAFALLAARMGISLSDISHRTARSYGGGGNW